MHWVDGFERLTMGFLVKNWDKIKFLGVEYNFTKSGNFPFKTESVIFLEIFFKQKKICHFRHLLAADTKEEREEWCLHLNKSLSLLKSWGHQH